MFHILKISVIFINLQFSGRRRPYMFVSIFKKKRKFLHRTPGYRNFRPIRSLYSTVVFKIYSWSWAAKEYKRRPSKVCCVFFAFCVRVRGEFVVCALSFLHARVVPTYFVCVCDCIYVCVCVFVFIFRFYFGFPF